GQDQGTPGAQRLGACQVSGSLRGSRTGAGLTMSGGSFESDPQERSADGALDSVPGAVRTEDQPIPATTTAESTPEAPRRKRPPTKKGLVGSLRELPVLLLLALVLALLIKTLLVQAFYIPSESMTNTLQVGDRVLVNKVVYHLHPPRR